MSVNVFNPINMEKWGLDEYEVGFFCPICGSSSGSLKLNIPKLMPKIPLGIPLSVPTGISKSCYENPNDLSIATTIQTQNFLTVPPQANRSFSAPLFSQGAKIMVEIHNKNPDTRFITTKVDNSVSIC